MTQRITTASGAILMLLSLSAHAEPLDIKLGLWESTSTTNTSGMTMPIDVLNNLPAERRARIEASMKARQIHGPKSSTEKSCMTKEDLNKPFEDKDGADKNCTSTIVTATRTHAEYRIECTGPEAHNAVMKVEAISRESLKATMVMNTGTGTVTNEITSKWISADCGNVQ